MNVKQIMKEHVARYKVRSAIRVHNLNLVQIFFNYMHFSLSLMFDGASDIQMHGNLNVFVNVCLYTGEVRTFTLALKCEIVRVTLPLTLLKK